MKIIDKIFKKNTVLPLKELQEVAMALSLETKTETTEKTSKSAALLNKYLTNAVSMTRLDTIIESHKTLSDYAKRSEWEGINPDDVAAKRKEVEKEMKGFGIKDKLAYYGNVKAGEHSRETTTKLGVIAAAMVVAATIDPDLSHCVAGAGMAYIASKTAAATIGAPQTPKELFSTRDYVDLKHAQTALKKLEGSLMKKENQKMVQQAIVNGAYFPGRGMYGR